MSSVESKAIFLGKLRKSLATNLLVSRNEAKALVAHRNAFCGDLVKVLPHAAKTYDQIVRDKKVVIRRYEILDQKIARIDLETFSDTEEITLGVECLNAANLCMLVIEAYKDFIADVQDALSSVGEQFLLEESGEIAEKPVNPPDDEGHDDISF